MASASQVPQAFFPMSQHQHQAFKLPSIDSISLTRPSAPLTLNIDSINYVNSDISDPVNIKTSPDSVLTIVEGPVHSQLDVAPIRIEPSPPPEHPPVKRPRHKSSPNSTPATSPGATSSICSERPTSNEGVTPPSSPSDGLPPVPETEFLDCYNYCSDCMKYLHAPEAYMEHLVDRHLKPSRLPSHLFEELKHKYERAALKPYSTFYPSKKRKPNSGRIPRPQNQYMIFSNYVRIPFMKYFNHVNHSEISRKISNMWKRLSDQVKQPFKEESKRCELIHKLEYPNYKYKPKQKKNAACKKVEPEPQKSCERSAPKKIEVPKKEHQTEIPAPARFFAEAPIMSEPPMQSQAPDSYPAYLSPGNLVLIDNTSIKNGFHFGNNGYQHQVPEVASSIKENDYGLSQCAEQIIYTPYSSMPSNPMVNSFVDAGGPKHAQMMNKRDPILAQNAAPSLGETGPLSWSNSVFINSSLISAQHSPPLNLLPNNICIGMNGQLMTNDGAVEQLRPTMSAGPTLGDMSGDGQPDLLGFPTLSAQVMEVETGREIAAGLDSNSLSTYDLGEDKNGAAFDDFLTLTEPISSMDSIDAPYMPSM